MAVVYLMYQRHIFEACNCNVCSNLPQARRVERCIKTTAPDSQVLARATVELLGRSENIAILVEITLIRIHRYIYIYVYIC